MSIERFCVEINEATLRQGDFLPRCLVPTFDNDLSAGRTHEIVTDEFDLIVVTQSCDLEQRKVRLVAACPIHAISQFETVNPAFAKKGRWNEVLRGRI